MSAEDTNKDEWAQSRTVTIQTSGPVDKVQYRVKDTKKWKDAAVDTDVEEGGYKFTIEDKSDKVVTYEVRALNTKDEQESETVPVQVGKIEKTAPQVTVSLPIIWKEHKSYTVTIWDKQSGLNVDSIQIRAFYEKDGRQYLPETHQAVTALNQALETQKTNWKNDKNDKNGNFEVSFTLPIRYEHYSVKVEVTVRDKAGNEGGHNRPSDLEQYGSIAATLNPSLYSVGNGYNLVGDQSTLKIDGVTTGEKVSLSVDNGEPISVNVNVEKPFELGQYLEEVGTEEGRHKITLKSDLYNGCELYVYYVSGAPVFDGVTFENQSAFKSFVHTITGGLMFANNKKLIIKPKADAAAGENTVGAAYFWQTGDTPAQLDNPELALDKNGTVVLSSQQEQQKESEQVVINDWAAATKAPLQLLHWLIIPCPKDNDFSGYLHVVVWNEVGTCTQYVYKVEGAQKLTNYGVFNGADNGVAVFVTTPDGKEVKAYTPDRDVLDERGNRTGTEDNWVKQVDFDVQWDENTLKTAAWKALKPELGDNYRIHQNDQGAETAPVISVTAKTKKVAEGASADGQKSFSLGANPEDQVSYSGNVEFLVNVKFTVDKKEENGKDENNNPRYEWVPQGKEQSHTFTVTVDKPVYVQNYLNVPTATASVLVTTNPGTDNAKTESIGTVLKDGETYGWYNGYDNVLTSLKLTKCAGSTAPYTMSYELTRPDKTVKNGSLSSEDLGKDGPDKNGLEAFTDNFNDDGVYTLSVWAKDAAGNKSETAAYTIKYDVHAPDVSAVFSLTSKDSPFYAEQRTIDIEVSDKLFEGSKNVTFEEGKPVSGNGVYTLTGTMKNTNQSGVSNVSIETTIQYTNGNPPMFDGAWTYTGAGEGKQTLPSWSGTYKYGSVDGNIRDGDDYTLCITATDEAGNVTKTNTDGTYTKNGKEPTGVGSSSSNCYTVVTKGTDKTDFTIDQTNPKVSVRFDNNSVVNGKYFPAGRTATITVVEHNFDRYRVELTATGSSGSTDWVDDGDTHTATVSFLNDADCEFAIRVKDKAGNICENDAVDYGDSAAPGEFVIDTTAPTLALTGVNGPFADACTPGFEGQDANMSTEYELRLMRSVRENAADDATALCSRELVNISTTDIRAVFQNIPDMLDNAEYYSDGIYKLSVTIRDMADNTTTQEATFAVNRHGSFYIYGEALANLVTKQFAQNDFVDAQTGAWTIMEYNASPVQPDSVQLQIYRDNALVTSVTPEIKGGMDDATGLYRYVYELDRNMFAQDGLYKVQVRSTDEAGNLSENIDEVDDNGNVTTPEKYQCTLSFVIDNVDPEFKQITGLEKRRYREDSHEINFAVADTYGLARVSVLSGETVVAEYLCAAEIDALGGETKLAANQKPMPNELTLESVSGDVMLQGGKSAQTITFVAVDKAGNTYTTGSADQKPLGFHQKVTISTNGFVLYIHNTWAVVLTVVALAAIAFGVWYGVSKKKKREGAAS